MSDDTIEAFPDHLWQRHRWRQHTVREWESICAVSSQGLKLFDIMTTVRKAAVFMHTLKPLGVKLYQVAPRWDAPGKYLVVDLLRLRIANDG